MKLFPKTTLRAAFSSFLSVLAIAAASAVDSTISIPAGSTPLPDGEIRIRDGVSTNTYVVVRDKIFLKPVGESNKIEEIPELATNAALEAYALTEELRPEILRAGIVVYPKGFEGEEKLQRVLMNKIAVKLGEGSRDAEGIARVAGAFGLEPLRDKTTSGGWIPFAAPSVFGIHALPAQLATHADVEDSYNLLGYRAETKICTETRYAQFFPNDPLYSPDQGYLNPPPDDDDNAGWFVHINVRPVWENAHPLTGLPFLKKVYTGTAVDVAVADDGLEIEHEDLDRNTPRGHNDWVDDDGDPTAGEHGTWVGGIIGAVGRNRIGLTGVAPRCDLSGLRFLELFEDDEVVEAVLDYRGPAVEVHNDSWGVPDNSLLADGPGPLALDAMEDNAKRDKIFVWAAGNGGLEDDVNYDGFANNIHNIAVGAINGFGFPATYTEPGACVLCCGVAADSEINAPELISTDRNNGYITAGLDGTSFAAPIVSGVVALMLDARPELGWRDVQEILVTTSTGGGGPNGGVIPRFIQEDLELGPLLEFGYLYSQGPSILGGQLVGYGLVDAYQAVRIAESWPLLPPQTKVSRKLTVLDNIGSETYFVDFSNRKNIRVEHATVELEWDDGSANVPCTVSLVSPTFEFGPGEYTSYLSDARFGIAVPEEWTFTSVAHWGQMSATGEEEGIWKLNVSAADGRKLRSYTVTLYGSPENTSPIVVNADIVSSADPLTFNPRTVTSDEDLVLTNIIVNDPDYDDPRVSFQWQALHEDGVTWQDISGAAGSVTGTCDWLPVANFTVDPLTPRAGEPAQFTSTSVDVGGTIVAWAWDFGDGGASAVENPVYTFADGTDQIVTLSVTDDSGNISIFGYEVVVLGPTQDPPDPLPEYPINPGEGLCIFDGTITYPAASTRAATMYRVQLRPQDDLREGSLFTSLPVIVNSTPVTTATGNEPYVYDADMWINNVPPDDFPPFILVNEVSQGTLGASANGEWLEILVAVGVDLRGYHITNDIVTFDLQFTHADLWSRVPPGTLIVVYNGEFRDTPIPPDDFDATDGVLIVSSDDPTYFTLPSNGDGWGEVSNGNEAHFGLLTDTCREIGGLSWNDDAQFVEIGDLPDGTAAAATGATIDSFEDAGFWYIGPATEPVPGGATPPAPNTDGVTPGAVNNTNNAIVLAQVIADDLTSIPTFSLDPAAPAWLSIDPATGVLSGTPADADVGTVTVTITFEHSFATETQTFDITVLPAPLDPPTSDEDRDTLIHMLEIAFGTDPDVFTAPAFALPSVAIIDSGDNLSLSYRRRKGGVWDGATQAYTWTDIFGNTYLYEVQATSDLVTWSSAADLPAGTLTQDGPPADSVDQPADIEVASFIIETGVEPFRALRTRVTFTPAP